MAESLTWRPSMDQRRPDTARQLKKLAPADLPNITPKKGDIGPIPDVSLLCLNRYISGDDCTKSRLLQTEVETTNAGEKGVRWQTTLQARTSVTFRLARLSCGTQQERDNSLLSSLRWIYTTRLPAIDSRVRDAKLAGNCIIRPSSSVLNR